MCKNFSGSSVSRIGAGGMRASSSLASLKKPNDGNESVKSSPAGFGLDCKQSSSSSPPLILTSVQLHHSPTRHKVKKDGKMTKLDTTNNFVPKQKLPVVSPTGVGSAGLYSDDDDSLSTNARDARINRIRIEMRKNRIRPRRNLSDIVRPNESVDSAYGSDEASC